MQMNAFETCTKSDMVLEQAIRKVVEKRALGENSFSEGFLLERFTGCKSYEFADILHRVFKAIVKESSVQSRLLKKQSPCGSAQ